MTNNVRPERSAMSSENIDAKLQLRYRWAAIDMVQAIGLQDHIQGRVLEAKLYIKNNTSKNEVNTTVINLH